MTIELFESTEQFRALKTVWNSLLEQNVYKTVFLRHEFLFAWWETFQNNKKLAIFVSKNNEQINGLAPFYRENNCLYFLGRPQADYADLLGSEKIKKELLTFIIEYSQKNGLLNICLDQISDRSGTFNIVKELNFTVLKQIDCPTLVIKGHEEEVKQNQLRKKSLKRHFNYFDKNGKLSIKHFSNSQEINKYLEKYFNQHIARWYKTDSPSLFMQPENKRFYQKMIEQFSETKHLVFSVVTWNEQNIAYHLGYDFAGTFTWYKPTYDPVLQDKSPGEVLIKYLLELAVAQNNTEFDFTRGIEGFKLRFANEIHTNYLAVLKKDLHYYKQIAVNWLRKYPTIEKIVKKFIN